MRKLTSHQLRDIVLVTGGVGLFIYILLRVINVSMSVDEQGSYFMFVTSAQFFPETYDQWSANNHALNTFLMWVCSNVFGPDQLSLRLPNLLAGGLYIFSTAMMARRLPSPVTSVVAFVLMNTNPYMIEYFGLARGYGLAGGFMALAFWQVWVYCDSGFRWRNLTIAMVACVLSVFANYSYLNLFLPLAGCIFIIAIWRPGAAATSTKNKLLQASIPLFVVTGTLLVVVPIARDISAAGGFWGNHFKTFWSDSIASVVLFSLDNLTSDESVIQSIVIAVEIITVLAFARIIWWTIQQWRQGELQIYPLLMLVTHSLAALSVMMQFWLLDTPLPLQRMCLIFVWPWLVIVGIAGSLEGKFKRLTVGLLVIITLVQTGLLFRTMSLEDMALRPPSVQVDDAIRYMRYKADEDQRILLGYDKEIWSSGFEYYRQTMPMKEFDIVRDSLTTHPLNEYCLISKLYNGPPIGTNWIPKQTYLNGTILYRNSSFTSIPKIIYELDLNRDTIYGNNGMTVLNFGGAVSDSMFVSNGMLLHIDYELVTASESNGYIDITIFRADQTLHYWRTEIYADSETRIAGENKIIVPPIRRGDFIVASLNIFPAQAQEIEGFSVTIEGY